MVAIISPSLLACDFAHLADEVARVLQAGADTLHVDVMDGNFVPNISIGPAVVKSLRKNTDAFLDCHLMVSNPEMWVEPFSKAGANMFTFHFEATRDPGALINEIHNAGMKAGIAIKPGTKADVVFEFCPIVDMVLVMTVEPGFGGQSFMPDMLIKVKEIRKRFPTLDIQVDGGLGLENIDEAARAGANVIVAGTSIFGSTDPVFVISRMRKSVENFIVVENNSNKSF